MSKRPTLLRVYYPQIWSKVLPLALTVIVLGLGFVTGQAHAQGDACTPVVTQMMENAAANCGALERNSVCYGAEAVEAVFVSDSAELREPSDRAALTAVTSLVTAPINVENQQYSAAILNVQANIPLTSENQAVTIIMLGDVKLENAVAPDEAVLPVEPVEVVVTASQVVNLRAGATTSDQVVTVAAPRDILLADGQNAAGDWLRVMVDDGELAWVSTSLVAAAIEDQDELEALPVVAGGAGGSLTPVQEFYFSTGLSLSGCADAPDLIVVQTPEDSQAELVINGLEVQLGSSAALFSTDTFFGDLLAYGIMEEQLLDASIADDTRCLHTRLVMLSGSAALGRVRVPTGHLSQWVTCLDSELTPSFVSEITPPARLSRDELAFFSVVELISDDLLHTTIALPSEADIDLALAGPRATPTRPAATRPATTGNTAVPRPTSAGGGGSTPAPTAVPPTPAPSGTDPDCSTFRATSPFGVVQGQQPFYWDAARNVNAYQLVIVPLVDGAPSGPQQLFRTGANNTTITVGISASFPSANGIRWYVQALVGSEPNFTAVCDTPAFDNPIG